MRIAARTSRRARALVRVGILLALASACQPGEPADDPEVSDTTAVAHDSLEVVVIEEAFETERDTLDDVDSPTVWHGPDDQHWLMTTAKATDVILVHDAATGEPIRRLGGTGSGPGQLERPNGVAAIADLLFVVERDNARIQVFSLPDLEAVGTFGEEELVRPYGIAAYQDQQGRVELYVTDNYELQEDVVPPDSMLGERVEHFRAWVEGGELRH